MNFSSDNVTGACPEIIEAVIATNQGPAMPYGADDGTARVEKMIADIFGCQPDVFLVATGTASNALALAVLCPPYGSIYCHPEAHIQVDECGAPEFYTGGAKLVPLADRDGKITAADLAQALASEHGDVHHVKPSVVSLTQAAETGVVYSIDEIRALCTVAHANGLKVHMDGARFANAVAALDCAPADMTWQAGVDVLSFGASKNGAIAAEAVILFEPDLAGQFAYRRKRAGHLFSKMRFISAQLEAYLKDDLWLTMAAHANQCSQTLATALGDLPGVTLNYPADANMIFATLPNKVIAGLRADGLAFYDWPGETRSTIRLVCAFNTKMADVETFIASARHHSA
ncbi:MAG TPA: low specificity L-threonine aldolase [Rhodospirillales bacterium]|nr:low specificity L-threonine aldolase [Rhodospirillales bacterium]